MKLSRERILSEAASAGFRPEVFEKVAHLFSLLQSIWNHPFLKNRLVLKGGTALNLFIFNLPRLSVDIDLNYIGAPDKETMLAERPKMGTSVPKRLNNIWFRGDKVFVCPDNQDLMHPVPYIMLWGGALMEYRYLGP